MRSNGLYSWAGATPGTTASTVNALNQIATHGGVPFNYDAKGNLTSDGTRSYSYDAENRLKSAGTASFFYDALGRLNWHAGLGGVLDHEGSRLVTELQGGTYAILKRYVHGPGSDEPLVSYDGTGSATRRWLHADERGSIVALSDVTGAVTARNRYDEYGLPAATNVGRFQYTGQKWLPVLGLYDYKARTYDPRLGRFLQPDPIGYGAGMNMYAYVGGDPVNFADPSGLRPCGVDEVMLVPKQPRVYGRSDGNSGIIVTGPKKECVSLQWLQENPQFAGAVYGPTVPGGSGGAPRSEAMVPEQQEQEACNQNLIALGNSFADASQKASSAAASMQLVGLGIAATGALSGQPEIVAPGLALVQVGGILGIGSALGQMTAGVLQGRGGADYDNFWNGGALIGSGLAFSRFVSFPTPAGYRTVSQRGSDAAWSNTSTVAGGVYDFVSNTIPNMGPSQKMCTK
jgi:RHS repeat-associated protein